MSLRNTLPFCIALAFGVTTNLHAAPAPAPAIANASAKGGPVLDVRVRTESVTDDAFARDADTTTWRVRAGWRTPVKSGFSAAAVLEHTGHLFGEHYNSTANGRVGYPTIADPDNTELDQAWLQYATPASRVTLGRQVLNLDSQRFIGAVGWRQNEQTFDALDMEHRFDGGLALRYSYLNRAQRVFGADNPTPALARFLLDAHLLHATYPLGPGTLTGYGYFIDNRTLPLTSHRDLGVRYAAKRDSADGIGWLATAEYANQHRYADGSRLIDANYTLLEGGLVWQGNTFKAGWERLSGNGRYAFQTPFATLHAFNGWADRFLTTPVNGLQDVSLTWSRPVGIFTATVAGHDFHSDRGSIHYGHELDASVGWKFAKNWNALAKIADYRADDVGADVTKGWLSVEYSY